MNDPVAKPTAAAALSDLAAKIKVEHQEVMAATGNVVAHAIKAGELLLIAKQSFDHGQWLPWLKDHCALDVRTAQRYMRLAKSKDKFSNTTSMSHLSLSEAYRMLAAEGEPQPMPNGGNETKSKKKTPQETPAGEYDKLEEKLIDKLKELDPSEAKDHAAKTIAALNDTVEDIVSIAKRAATKAAKLGAVAPA